jgi:FAD/FMN-containing dehydrogenase
MIGDGALFSTCDRKKTTAAPATSSSMRRAARIRRGRSTAPILEGIVVLGRGVVRLLEQFSRRVTQSAQHRKGLGPRRIVHDQVVRMNGSISAEHGIGQLKRDELRHYKSALEIELMQRVKAALDPDGIMNPGKILRPA